MAIRTPPSFLQNITLVSAGHTAQNDRLTQAGLVVPGASLLQARSGILPGPVGARGEVTVNSNTQVTVNPFRAIVQGTRSAIQGAYTVLNDAAVALTIGAQGSGVSRKDLVMVNVCDTAFSPDTLDTARLIVVAGTPAASNPAEPSLGGANLGNFLVLGVLNVPATGGTVTFTPRAGLSTVAAGGVLPVDDLATIDALTGQYPSQEVYDLATRRKLYWTGSEWRKYAGPREVIYENRSSGNSGQVGPVNTVVVLGYTITSPIAADHAQLVLQLGLAATSGTIATFRLIAGVYDCGQQINVTTGQLTLVLDCPVPRGNTTVAVEMKVEAGGAIGVSYSGLRATV